MSAIIKIIVNLYYLLSIKIASKFQLTFGKRAAISDTEVNILSAHVP